MKKFFTYCLASYCLLNATNSYASQFGIGFVLGEPIGLSLKYYTNDTTAFQLGLGSALDYMYSGFIINADYLIHKNNFINVQSGNLAGYYGFGLRIMSVSRYKYFYDNTYHSNNGLALGLRIPLGISYKFSDIPLDLFAELVPTVNIVSFFSVDINLALGLRFYIN